MRARQLTGLIAAGGLIAALATTPASADPKGETFQVVCDNNKTYTITVNGNGEFTPGHDTNSTAVLIPLSFQDFTITITPPGGPPQTFTDPAVIRKGQSGKNARNTVNCTFSFNDTDPDGTTFVGSGSVTAFVTPRGRS
jgi:hypothetical protein